MQDKVHAPPGPGGAYLEDVEGFTSASPRQSLVTAAGALRLDPIEGVRYRLARPVSSSQMKGSTPEHDGAFCTRIRLPKPDCSAVWRDTG